MEAAATETPGHGTEEFFGTETMAELCARQGRVRDAVVIYRKLLRARAGDERCPRWRTRLAELERAATKVPEAAPPPSAPPKEPEAKDAEAKEPPPVAADAHRMPVVVRQPVRSGQVVYGEKNDVIVLAPVHAGAQIVADGNIHVYGTLRGRAMAGAQGCADARIFCQKLEAELIAINGTYVTCDDIPPDRIGKPAQIFLQDGRCVVAAL